MKNINTTRNLLIKHYNTYPEMQVRDIFKFLYQSTFGCEHLVSNSDGVKEYIEKEFAGISPEAQATVEELDGNYCRVHLSYLNEGLSADTLAKLFIASAKKEDGLSSLKEKLDVVREMVAEKLLPFSVEEFESALGAWEDEGYPAIRHSEAFREKYRPAYRVISKDLAVFLPLFAKLDAMLEKGNVRLAIEGGSASGKTTLGGLLEKIYGCTVFHMDDFFLRPQQRTPERYAEIGGNVDRERFLSEVLIPLSRGEDIEYRKFDCSVMDLGPVERVTPERLTVIEGAYSMHPELAGYYDLSVFLDVSPEKQRERIIKRNGPKMAQRFFGEWIPLETKYFEGTDIMSRCDMVIFIDN